VAKYEILTFFENLKTPNLDILGDQVLRFKGIELDFLYQLVT